MDHRANIITGAVVACFSLLLSACADSGADKAGERQGRDPTILTFANVALGLPAQLDVYAREVEALSGGTLRIEFHNHWRPNSTTFEIDTIDDVRAGEVDMAWVGARAFDVVGVTSFQALLAPMLVDSYDLQAAVFEAGIPDRMLGGLRSTGLEGIGVLPSPMERIMGISHAFVNPADFEGEVVGTVRSALGEQTFEALGATPQWGVANSKNATAGLDATNASLLNIFRLSGERAGRGFTTANLNLWPRPLVLFMEADRFAALAPEHRDILR
ncbi:MAG: hypothetical protein M3N52_02530, partial [Actinomycetota bacterium]|nr:hypothetical protein [Actinomycetota bacterium]